MFQSLLHNLSFYIPEIALTILMCLLLFIESSYSPRESKRTAVFVMAFIGLTIALCFQVDSLRLQPTLIFSKAISIDPMSSIIKVLMIVGAIASAYVGIQSRDIYKELKSEYLIMMIAVLVGGMLLASANNMLTLYLGIETLSIISYVMASFKRHDSVSTEAGMKYALFGGISAGVMLFGMSHIYGLTGTIQFSELAQKISMLNENSWILMASFVMFFAGISYKLAAFPFHMWSPDVYQGSPLPVTMFFASVPKFAAIAALIRVSLVFFSSESTISTAWINTVQLIAVATMTIGNVTAIGQDSVKRILAFSSIAHVGFILMASSVVGEIGTQSIIFYSITYLFMTVSAFLVVSLVNEQWDTDSQSVFRGLIQKDPILAIVFSIVLFSLAGLPPLSGFVAKFNILSVIIEKKLYGLALIAAINSVISLYYYLRLAKVCLIDKPEFDEVIKSSTTINKAVVVLSVLPVVALGIFWERTYKLASALVIFQ